MPKPVVWIPSSFSHPHELLATGAALAQRHGKSWAVMASRFDNEDTVPFCDPTALSEVELPQQDSPTWKPHDEWKKEVEAKWNQKPKKSETTRPNPLANPSPLWALS